MEAEERQTMREAANAERAEVERRRQQGHMGPVKLDNMLLERCANPRTGRLSPSSLSSNASGDSGYISGSLPHTSMGTLPIDGIVMEGDAREISLAISSLEQPQHPKSSISAPLPSVEQAYQPMAWEQIGQYQAGIRQAKHPKKTANLDMPTEHSPSMPPVASPSALSLEIRRKPVDSPQKPKVDVAEFALAGKQPQAASAPLSNATPRGPGHIRIDMPLRSPRQKVDEHKTTSFSKCLGLSNSSRERFPPHPLHQRIQQITAAKIEYRVRNKEFLDQRAADALPRPLQPLNIRQRNEALAALQTRACASTPRSVIPPPPPLSRVSTPERPPLHRRPGHAHLSHLHDAKPTEIMSPSTASYPPNPRLERHLPPSPTPLVRRPSSTYTGWVTVSTPERDSSPEARLTSSSATSWLTRLPTCGSDSSSDSPTGKSHNKGKGKSRTKAFPSPALAASKSLSQPLTGNSTGNDNGNANGNNNNNNANDGTTARRPQTQHHARAQSQSQSQTLTLTLTHRATAVQVRWAHAARHWPCLAARAAHHLCNQGPVWFAAVLWVLAALALVVAETLGPESEALAVLRRGIGGGAGRAVDNGCGDGDGDGEWRGRTADCDADADNDASASASVSVSASACASPSTAGLATALAGINAEEVQRAWEARYWKAWAELFYAFGCATLLVGAALLGWRVAAKLWAVVRMLVGWGRMLGRLV